MSLVAIVLTVFRELASTASPSPIEGIIDSHKAEGSTPRVELIESHRLVSLQSITLYTIFTGQYRTIQGEPDIIEK
jgi:hypothetical protein